jgi:hypothetical protein
MFMMI